MATTTSARKSFVSRAVIELVVDPQQDKGRAGHADGKTGEIEKGKSLAA